MNSKYRVYFIGLYVVLSGVMIVKHGLDVGNYLQIAFGVSSIFFLIALLKMRGNAS